jgi:hypothetical protein
VEITSFPRSPVSAALKLELVGEMNWVSGGGAAFNSTWSLLSGELLGGASLNEVAKTPLQLPASSEGSFSLKHHLVLQPRALVPGGQYTFVLTHPSASASVQVSVARPPSSGSVVAFPGAGFAFETLFELAAADWVGDALPLNYAFFTDAARLSLLLQSSHALNLQPESSSLAHSPSLTHPLESLSHSAP